MNIFTRYSIVTSLAVMSFSHIPVANSATGGVINFTGAIVEGSCNIDNTGRDINIGCYRAGKTTNTILPISKSRTEFPQGKVKVKWLNESHTLAVLKIVYN
ncbi:hypothetical protein [Serratia aquatilis]|uniref:Type 1 fimbrial protein n=1 Tax=Serratia aquatilis TaxID=1737515 RepID=A0ABV6EIL1_9GAMM